MNRLLRMVTMTLITLGAVIVWLTHEMSTIEQAEM